MLLHSTSGIYIDIETSEWIDAYYNRVRNTANRSRQLLHKQFMNNYLDEHVTENDSYNEHIWTGGRKNNNTLIKYEFFIVF